MTFGLSGGRLGDRERLEVELPELEPELEDRAGGLEPSREERLG